MWGFWEFIVSGRLPGTAIQVTFEHWLYAIAGLAGLILLAGLVRGRIHVRLGILILGLYAAWVISTDGRSLTSKA